MRLPVALRFARRELRSGLGGFRVFVACLALGVAAIAGVNSLSQAVQDALRSDARILAGGDVLVRTSYRPLTDAQRDWIAARGEVAAFAEMRAMAIAPERRTLVELKAVDDAYPVYGKMVLSPDIPLREALRGKDGEAGAVAEQALLDQLGVRVGDRLSLGEATFTVRAAIVREPDRGISLVNFGPRVMIGAAALPATGLVQPGSLVRWHYNVRLPDEVDAGAFRADLLAAFPDQPWRVTLFSNAAPGLNRTVERLTLFLTLVGLTVLLVGGVGVANAVRSHLASKTGTIATLKCLGAPAGTVFATYLAQVLALAGAGIAIGLVVGAAAPALLAGVIRRVLPIAITVEIHPSALLLAAAFGLLTALAFSLYPLARAREVPAASLFRDLVAPVRRWPRPALVGAIALAAAALAGLTVATAEDRVFAAWFVVGAAAALLLFQGAARLLAYGAAAAGRPARPSLRLALANLHRPGAATGSVVLSLGFAVTVLVAVALIEGNLRAQIRERIPERAPTFFFIDIQPQQVEGFARIVAATPGVTALDRMPHIRARISRIDGVPVADARIAPEAQWAVRNERGLTWSATPPEHAHIVAGRWWPADYDGPPAISFDANLARGFGIGIGDTLTFNVLGREIEARIANLRDIDWRDLQMQFTVIFAPGVLERAPQTFIATVLASPEAEAPLVRAVTDRFANISAIRVKDALEAASRILGQIGAAVRAIAAIGILAGALVLAGAIAAGQRRRVYDAVVLKVLGATRADVLRAWLLEFLLLGVATAAIGAATGTLAAYVILTQVMGAPWTLLPGAAAATALVCVGITVVFGFVGIWRALGRKAAPLLRHP